MLQLPFERRRVVVFERDPEPVRCGGDVATFGHQTIEDALERDNFLTADKAKEFGLIDKVIDKRPEDTASKAA